MNYIHKYLQNNILRIKILVFFLLFLAINLLHAQSSIDTCKLKMIDNINQGKFEEAMQDMTCVENWTFNAKDVLLDVNRAQGCLSYMDSLQQDKALSDSLWNYFFEECGYWGIYYRNIRDNLKAKPYYEGSLYFSKVKFGERSLLYAGLLNSMGVIHYDLYDYTKAETCYLESLEVFNSLSNVPDYMYIALLDNLGDLYFIKGDLIKSKDYYLQELKQKSISGEKQLEDITLLNKLGNRCLEMDEYQEAEFYFAEALQVHKSISGEQDSIYITMLHNIGDFYAKIGDDVKAEENYLLALQIAKSIFEKPSCVIAESLEKLSMFYLLRDKSKAERYSLEALEQNKLIYGEQHWKIVCSNFLVGTMYSQLHEYQKAKSYYLSVLQVPKMINKLLDPMMIYLVFLGLSDLSFEMGETTEAESYLDKVIQIQHSLHPFPLINASLLSCLGGYYNGWGNYSKAAESYLSALEIRRTLFNEQH